MQKYISWPLPPVDPTLSWENTAADSAQGGVLGQPGGSSLVSVAQWKSQRGSEAPDKSNMITL